VQIDGWWCRDGCISTVVVPRRVRIDGWWCCDGCGSTLVGMRRLHTNHHGPRTLRIDLAAETTAPREIAVDLARRGRGSGHLSQVSGSEAVA
jgi:hypothetical protein